MFRILFFFVLVLLAGLGLADIADLPGNVTVTIGGAVYETSLIVAAVALLLLSLALMLLWGILSFILRLPALVGLSNTMRRRSKGFAAISRGIVAVGSGDAHAARRQAGEAQRFLGREPLTLLLTAQAAQLSGDRVRAEAAFSSMLETEETRVLGLRGLFVEARRRGEATARAYAEEAHAIAPTVPWASQSVLEYACADGDWTKAIATVDANAGRNVVPRSEARRQRAILLAAKARDLLVRSPDEALRASLAALKLEPGLVPAAVIAGHRLSERGDYGKASRILESAWRQSGHPEIAETYLDVRKGDSALDRLKRARTLMKLMPDMRETKFTLARAALDAREFGLARENLESLVLERPTVRACLLMAELEEKEANRTGLVREWLSRASRAPRDPAWVADGVVSERWAPVSPVSGRIDAFEWREPPQAIEASLRSRMDVFPIEDDHRTEPADGKVIIPIADGTQARPLVTEAGSPSPEPSPPRPREHSTHESESRASASQAVPTREPVAAEAADSRRSSAARKKPTPIIFPISRAPDDPGPALPKSSD
jgi:HemY protein